MNIHAANPKNACLSAPTQLTLYVQLQHGPQPKPMHEEELSEPGKEKPNNDGDGTPSQIARPSEAITDNSVSNVEPSELAVDSGQEVRRGLDLQRNVANDTSVVRAVPQVICQKCNRITMSGLL